MPGPVELSATDAARAKALDECFLSVQRQGALGHGARSEALNAASDPHPSVRRRAIALLGYASTEDEGAKSAVRAGLDDESPAVQAEAAAAAGDLEDLGAAERLRELAHHPHEDLRFEAALALARLADRSVDYRAVLTAALAAPKRRLDALAALRRLADPAQRDAVARLARRWWLPWPDRLSALATAHALGAPEATDALRRALARGSGAKRIYAVGLIAEVGVDAFRPQLETLAQGPEPVAGAARDALLGAQDQAPAAR